METFVDIISDIGAQISKIKRCRVNQQTLSTILCFEGITVAISSTKSSLNSPL